MNYSIYVLDSTLRDGGYCNNWEFGSDNKRRIITGLLDSRIDVIECGLLSKGNFSKRQSKYADLKEVEEFLPKQHAEEEKFAVLINHGDYDISSLPDANEMRVKILRYAFHKKDLEDALEQIKLLVDKNYKVFMQPMVTASYTSEEYVELLLATNRIKPYAFYIVDSFGSMKSDSLMKYSELAKYFLSNDILLGFHSHNNLQLAYSNAQLFVKETPKRNVIIDSCIMGMGRGAGNLNTELFLNYMNENYGKEYRVEPILSLIDEIISVFFQKKYWGYSLPYYLSATHNMHPNYGLFLSDKNTLTVSLMNELLSQVSDDKKNKYDKAYIEELYVSYMTGNKDDKTVRADLKELFNGKRVLVIAPGKSIDTERDRVQRFIDENDVVVLCINFNSKEYKPDYIFSSNVKRFEEMERVAGTKLIVTSNIEAPRDAHVVDYMSLTCDVKSVEDNSAMMLIKLLIDSGVDSIYLAGLDGYEDNIEKNYSDRIQAYVTSQDYLHQMNEGMNLALKMLAEQVDINFVTTEKAIRRE